MRGYYLWLLLITYYLLLATHYNIPGLIYEGLLLITYYLLLATYYNNPGLVYEHRHFALYFYTVCPYCITLLCTLYFIPRLGLRGVA